MKKIFNEDESDEYLKKMNSILSLIKSIYL